MANYAYIRGGRVDHLSASPDEKMAGVEAVVEVPAEVTVNLFDLYDSGNDAFSMSPENAVAGIDPVIRFNIPASAAKAVDTVVGVTVENATDDSLLDISETYYVPLMNLITKEMDQMLLIPIVSGVGSVTFACANQGVYGVNPDLIRPRPTARFAEIPDIPVY